MADMNFCNAFKDIKDDKSKFPGMDRWEKKHAVMIIRAAIDDAVRDQTPEIRECIMGWLLEDHTFSDYILCKNEFDLWEWNPTFKRIPDCRTRIEVTGNLTRKLGHNPVIKNICDTQIEQLWKMPKIHKLNDQSRMFRIAVETQLRDLFPHMQYNVIPTVVPGYVNLEMHTDQHTTVRLCDLLEVGFEYARRFELNNKFRVTEKEIAKFELL